MMRDCPVCGGKEASELYKAEGLPVFQNLVFASQDQAIGNLGVTVALAQCLRCGMVFNSAYDAGLVSYDSNYHNEQHYSGVFNNHLESLADHLAECGYQKKSVVEIGCGKGYLLELLASKGFNNLRGFDPAYEGTDNRVIKDYFSSRYRDIRADLIILRHTLEHIDRPLDFLKEIVSANNSQGKIYIEVPDFSWTLDRKAFWDVYYEHCNYFSETSLAALFGGFCDTGHIFGDQYLYAMGPLSAIHFNLESADPTMLPSAAFEDSLFAYADILKKGSEVVVWGAASKGVIFANLLDSSATLIRFLVDVNPHKQGKFIARTGHPIYSPDVLKGWEKHPLTIIVTNNNYYHEIREKVDQLRLRVDYIIL